MQAVILAGERGAPLYPLTARQPRAMLPLAGKPLVQYQLELLKRHGISEAILCLQVQPETFEGRFGDGKELGMTLRYHREQAPLGTAGAVRAVSDRLVGDTVLVLNGHILTDADLTRLIALHEEKAAAVTMLLVGVPEPFRYGVVVRDAEHRILSFAEKPALGEVASDTINAGVYVLRRDLLRRMPPDTEYSFERQLFPQLLAEGVPMYGIEAQGYWRSISTLTDYQQGQADILERKVHTEIGGNQVREGVWVGANANVHPTADLRGRIFVNHHTEIAKDAKISGVVAIGSRCRIGEGAVIEDSIIWRGSVIEPGAVVRGCILGDNTVVRAGASVQPGTVIGADAVIASVVAKLPSRGDIQRASIKFGTDGWRGIIADDFTVDNVRLVSQAVCDWVNNSDLPGKGSIIVGYDRRSQSEVFARAVAQVAQANHLKVLLSDRECSSPVVSFACRYYGAAAGIMITASHNPPQFNGLKIKVHYGGSATPEMVARIEESLRVLLRSGAAPRYTRDTPPATDLAAPYLEHCARFVDLQKVKDAGFKVIVDPMHGSGAGYLSGILRAAGVDVTEIRSERNSFFGGINPEPIASNMEALFSAVTSSGADVGICLDGDADRLGACDSQGNFVDCHRIFAVLLRHLYEERKWTGGVVRTVSTTRALDKLCAKFGLPLTETPIGFKYICEKMLDEDILIGGEESGGIGVKNHLPERDGVLMGMLLLEAMAAKGKRLEALIDDIFAMVGQHEYTRTDLHPPQEKMHAIISQLQSFKDEEFAGGRIVGIVRKDGTRLDFEDGSWLLLRPSGTEPVVRVYAEAESQERAQELVNKGVALVQDV